MKKYDIAIGVNADRELKCAGISNMESVKQIKKAGFKKVFITWMYNSWGETQEKIIAEVKRNKLEIVFAHVAYFGEYKLNTIWEDGKHGDKIADMLINDLKKLKNHGIKIAVVHPCERMKPDFTQIALNRWQKIVKSAEEIGITIAIENLRYLDVIDYLFDNIESDNLKICYDAGHNHCNSNDAFDFEKYNNKIVATHIHDNDGEKDLHLIPFHGNIDWNVVLNNLKKHNKNLTLSSEIYYRLGYKICSSKKFYKQTYKAMKKLYKNYENF